LISSRVILRDEHVVFDTHTAPAGKVDTGLERHHHAGRQNGLDAASASPRDAWAFMYLEPQAVTSAMRKRIGQPMSSQRLARRPIRRLGLLSRAQRLKRCALRFNHLLDQLALTHRTRRTCRTRPAWRT
jgi:hypothetical protein